MPPSTAKASPHQITQSYNDAYAAIMMSPHDHARAPSFPSIQSRQAANAKSKVSIKKPKRPLSGYNLFYRYKRIQILEATAHTADGSDTKAIIDTVITALPGLESVDAREHPLWTTYPEEAIQKLRASNIRAGMEGKLFPNENTRNRLHRKVHGMGFVEMGKTMREMWANIDNVTKEVFCELADVGRGRYKTLLAEWKAEVESDGSAGAGSVGPTSIGEEKVLSPAGQPAKKRRKTKQPNSVTATTVTISPPPSPAAAASLAPMNMKIGALALEKPIQAASNPNLISFPRTSINNSNKRRFNWDSLEPIPIGTRSHMPMAGPTSADLAAPNKPRFARRVSDPSDHDFDLDLGRSNSTTYTPNPLVMGSSGAGAVNTPASVMFGNSSVPSSNNKASQEISKEFLHEYQQFLLKNAMILQNAFLANKLAAKQNPMVTPPLSPFHPAPPVQQQQHRVSSQNSNNGCGMMPMSTEGSYLDIISSRYSTLSNNVEVMPPLFENNQDNQDPRVSRKEGVSAQDLEELIGLAETPDHLNDDDDHTFSSEEGSKDDWFDDELSLMFGNDQHIVMEKDLTSENESKENVEDWNENDLSFVFGKPTNDLKVNSNTSAVPMPAPYELNNKRALMA